MVQLLKRRIRSGLLLAVVLLALPLLAACAPHDPPTGPVISGDELAKQYQAADEARGHMKAFAEAQDWSSVRQANEQATQALAALGPAVYALDHSTWFSIVDAKFDLDEEMQKAKPSRAYVVEKVNELGGALRTAGIKLGLVK